MRESAYRATSASEAVATLSRLVGILEVEAKRPNPEYAVADGVWVNKARLAGAVYATGDKERALNILADLARERAHKDLTVPELVSGQHEIMRWIAHEYSVRQPRWGAAVARDFQQLADEESLAPGTAHP